MTTKQEAYNAWYEKGKEEGRKEEKLRLKKLLSEDLKSLFGDEEYKQEHIKTILKNFE